MKVFGNKNIGVNYFVRKGAYAVIFKNQNRSEKRGKQKEGNLSFLSSCHSLKYSIEGG